jgi:hypothetical protein
MTANRRFVVLCAVAGACAATARPATAAPTLQAQLAHARDGATIRLPAGVFDGPVTVTASITLQGAGAGRTIIRGGGPVITIGSSTSAPTVTLADLTVTGGVSNSDPQAPHCGPDTGCGPGYPTVTALGGGIEAFPGTRVTLLRDAVTGNLARPVGTVPSTVSTCPGDTPCPISLAAGGGIDNWGAMTLDGTTVRDNRATGIQANGGAIVDEAGATLALRDATVTGNVAAAPGPLGRFASGGAIHVATGGRLTVEDSRVSSNHTLLANTIPSPYPEQGGGVAVNDACCGAIKVSTGGSLTIRRSHIDRNTVTVDAPLGEPFGTDAALCACDADVPLDLEDSTVHANTLAVRVRSSADAGPSGPSAIEADSDTLIRATAITGNAITITATDGDAAAFGAIAFYYFGEQPPVTIAHSLIAANRAVATSPHGTATVQGAGITNDGPLLLDHDLIAHNHGDAHGATASAQGAGIWNGVTLGGPDSPLTLHDTTVTANALTGSPGAALAGAGLYTVGFPTTITDSPINANTPDQCAGCAPPG